MQKIILYFFLLLFFDYGILFAGNQNKIIVFYNSECDNCIIVKETVLVPLLKKENLNYEILDITFADTYMLFTEIEKITGDTQNFETPIVLFNNKLFSGKDEILNDFTDEIEYCRKNKIDGFYKKKITEIIEHKNNIIKKRFDIPYFFKKGCSECSRIEKDLQLIKSSNPLINIIKFNITDSYSTVLYESLCEKFGVNRENRLIVPAVFVKSNHLIRNDLNLHSLNEKLEKYAGEEYRFIAEDYYSETGKQRIAERFEKFSVIAVLAAGLIDGINPCSFAVIIFLVSYFIVLKKEKKIILFSGLSFIAGIFIAYYSVGAGLIEFMYNFSFLKIFIKYVFYLFSIILFVLSILNFYDFVLCCRGKTDKLLMQLPIDKKIKIHDIIKKSGKSVSLILPMFFCGMTVSLYEFGCTGQIYLPTIMFVSKNTDYRLKSYFYLFLYNAMFVIPLLIILFAVYKGAGSNKLLRFFNRHIALSKLFSAILFLGLGILLITSV